MDSTEIIVLSAANYIGLALGNYVYQLFASQNWELAASRSGWEFIALATLCTGVKINEELSRRRQHARESSSSSNN